MKIKCSLACIVFAMISWTGQAQNLNLKVAEGKFKPTVESLKQYKTPQWFADAKFGIWSHWGPVSVPGYIGNWYARQMYIQGTREYDYHVKTYGHPSEFGYKDIINLWKAEKFDPDYLMDLYVKAGAKYFVSMGSHHDNFDLWNSKHHEWNSVNYGPKKDIVGMWRNAALKRGLRFGVSEHFARAYNWMQLSHDSDKTGPKAGVPYDGNNPKYESLYFKKHDDASKSYPVNPPAWWKKQWYDRMQDIVDNYKPDLLYSDGGIPFEEVGYSFMADFYNKNMKLNKGKLQAVYNYKDEKDCGTFIEGLGVQDVEQISRDAIFENAWQTDETTAQWFWVKEPWKPKNSSDIIVMLADIVSKNGNLLLNVPQRPDGMIDDEQVKLLKEVGDWIKINGEGIYGSRPWTKFGEGPSLEPFKGVRRAKNYTASDFRFTTKGGYLYAFCLSSPTTAIKIKSLAGMKIRNIEMLGYKGKLNWKVDSDCLSIDPVSENPSKIALVYKIKLNQ